MTTLTDGPCTEAERRQRLRWLARSWDESPEGVRVLPLHEAAHPSLSAQELMDTWDSYLGHLALQDGINGVPGATEAHWSDINPELKGPDRTQQARDEIAERVAADEDYLLRGKR